MLSGHNFIPVIMAFSHWSHWGQTGKKLLAQTIKILKYRSRSVASAQASACQLGQIVNYPWSARETASAPQIFFLRTLRWYISPVQMCWPTLWLYIAYRKLCFFSHQPGAGCSAKVFALEILRLTTPVVDSWFCDGLAVYGIDGSQYFIKHGTLVVLDGQHGS
jgi:hypothetical protein